MPKLKIIKSFPFAHRGIDVVNYEAGQEVDTDDAQLVEVALAEKWAKRVGEKGAGGSEKSPNDPPAPAPSPAPSVQETAGGDQSTT